MGVRDYAPPCAVGGQPLTQSSIAETRPAAPGVAARPRASLRSLGARRILLGYLLVAPAVIWRLAVTIYPFLYTGYLSFFDRSPVRRTFNFVGLGNYHALLNDSQMRDTFGFTVYFAVVSVSLQIVLGLAIAVLLSGRFRLRHFARAVNLIPWAMSGIVIGTAARWFFNVDYGLVNDIIWRISGARPLWLVDANLARLAVTFTDVWKNTAFLAVIFIGGLQGIPTEVYEAAKMDGADGARSFRYITLPLLMPLVVSMAIFVTIFRVLSFEIVYALTSGGPGMATSLMSYQVYLQGFRVLNFGYASAISMGLFLMVLIVGIFGFGLLRRAWART
jgi:multiple sugar transport system permease protein